MARRFSVCGPGGRAPDLGLQRHAAGYAAVDAMVAMLILALTLILSLRAVEQARETAHRALELRRAAQLIAGLMQEGSRELGVTTGRDLGFSWSLSTASTGAERPVALCRRHVEVASHATARTYGASRIETCPPVEGS